MSPTDERPEAGLPASGLQDVAAPVLSVDVDAPLVQRVQRGDQKAFEMLVVKYRRRI